MAHLPLTAEGAVKVDEEFIVLMRAIASALMLPRNHDQANNSDRVSIVAGSVGISANQDLRNVSNILTLN